MAIRLVLADDHPIFLGGLADLFRPEKDITVLAACRTGEEALEAVRAHRPDVLVLDIRMPGLDGLGVLRALRQEKLPTRTVLLTAELEEREALEAFRLEVQGVVLKEMAPQLLVQAVRKVHAGEPWFERQSLRRALDRLLLREAGARQIAGLLTSRELELVRLVAHGLRNRVIADRLCISEATVKDHLHNVYEKLQVDGRVALTVLAREKGLV